MEISALDKQQLKRYLLGQMVEEDLSQVEERLMSESALYEELLILEDELIDQYVRGQMPESDRASFENYFLKSAEHQQKLRFARALGKYVDQAVSAGDLEAAAKAARPAPNSAYAEPVSPTPKPRRFRVWPFQTPALNYALAAVVVIAIAGIAWMAWQSSRPSGPGQVFEATLFPGGIVREGSDIQTISIPAGTDTLRLHLTLPAGQYHDYKVELVAEGTSVLTRDQLTPTETSGKKSLPVDIPATNLKRGPYRLKLSARSDGAYEEIASYTFRVK